ncbi:MAG TPA: alpha-L-rhamnosidase C-terminal domain-containing protein, partial [Streptosporangiaceae bacterium]
LLRPHPGGSLDWARGSYRSVRGTIRAGWKRDRSRFTYWAELPPNVTGTVRIPSRHPAEVRDAAGHPPASLDSFPGAGDAQEAVFQVGSGAHEFSGPAINEPGYSDAGHPLSVARSPAVEPAQHDLRGGRAMSAGEGLRGRLYGGADGLQFPM